MRTARQFSTSNAYSVIDKQVEGYKNARHAGGAKLDGHLKAAKQKREGCEGVVKFTLLPDLYTHENTT